MGEEVKSDTGVTGHGSHKTKNCLSGRLTIKKLIKWCNEQFAELGVNEHEVFEIHRTHFNQNEYECGACRLVVKFKNKKMKDGEYGSVGMFYCFYKVSELEEHLKNGYELYLKDTGRHGLLSNLEIEIRKK